MTNAEIEALHINDLVADPQGRTWRVLTDPITRRVRSRSQKPKPPQYQVTAARGPNHELVVELHTRNSEGWEVVERAGDVQPATVEPKVILPSPRGWRRRHHARPGFRRR